MNPQAAQELLDLIMLDEFVARRKALDDWSRRWIATMHIEQVFDPVITYMQEKQRQALYLSAAESLRREMLNGLAKDEAHVLLWGKLADNPNSLVLQMHTIRQLPLELSSGADAAKTMMDMARGGK